MIVIEKGGIRKTVSRPAYNNFFADFGWKIAGEEKSSPVSEERAKEKTPVVEEVAEEIVEDDDDSEDEIADEEWEEAENEIEVEKPLSEMNRAELVAKAESLGIEAKGNNSQLREAIKAKM